MGDLYFTWSAVLWQFISVCSNMHKDECNILGMDSPFEGWHSDRYSLNVWSDSNSIFIAMPRGDLFSLLSFELLATFLVSFIMHLMSLSNSISSISSLWQSPSVICNDSDSSPYSTVVILGIAVIMSPKSPVIRMLTHLSLYQWNYVGINLKGRFWSLNASGKFCYLVSKVFHMLSDRWYEVYEQCEDRGPK